jgi:hypothetical protein
LPADGASPGLTRPWFLQGNLSAEEVTQESGISALFPDADIHEYLFTPCGYSCNALLEVSVLWGKMRKVSWLALAHLAPGAVSGRWLFHHPRHAAARILLREL